METELIKEDDDFLYLNLFDKKSELRIFNGFGFELEPNENFEPAEMDEDIEDTDWYGGIPSEDVMDVLNSHYESEYLVSGFRKQSRLLDNLNSFSEENLKSIFYESLKIPLDKTKQEFIELVKQKTEPYFNR
jgi:hypothetical protein